MIRVISMLQIIFELCASVLAVYGFYTLIHQALDTVERWMKKINKKKRRAKGYGNAKSRKRGSDNNASRDN